MSTAVTTVQAGSEEEQTFVAGICGRIQERRVAVGVTWRELVAASGIPETRMRRGNNLTFDDLLMLEAPLGCSMRFLLFGDREAPTIGGRLRAV